MHKNKTAHYVNDKGDYIGGFGDGAKPPRGSMQVDVPPTHGKDKLDFDTLSWVPYMTEEKKADESEREALETNKHKAMELIIHLAYDINQAQPNILNQKTKQLAQELKALLRS